MNMSDGTEFFQTAFFETGSSWADFVLNIPYQPS
jgi:hypothetical protein